MPAIATPAERFLSAKAVIERTSLSTSTIYAMMSRGDFPRPVQLTKGRVAWREADVARWIEARLAEAA